MYGFRFNSPLKWVRSIKEIAITPVDLFDYSDGAFLCTDKKQILLISKNDGTVIKKSTEFSGFANIAETFNGGFVIVKGNSIVLLNQALDKIWSKMVLDSTVTLVSVCQIKDSGFVALGNNKINKNVHVIKTDKRGDTLWTRTCKKSGEDIFTHTGIGVIEIENGYIVCQSYCSGICNWQNALFSKYSESGVELWSGKYYGLTVKDMISINGTALFTGEYDPNTEPDLAFSEYPVLAKRQYFVTTSIYYLHLGADGNILKHESIGGGFAKSWGNSIKQNNSNSIIAGYATFTNPLNNKVLITEVTETGVSKLLKEYIIPNTSVFPLALPLLSGELIVFTKDSLYYYEKPTKVQPKPVEQRLNQVKQISLISNHTSIIYILSHPLKLKIDLLSYDGKFIQCMDQGMKTAGFHVLNTKALTSGIYFLRFKCDNMKNIYRIILNR